jgi:hypothetical protein
MWFWPVNEMIELVLYSCFFLTYNPGWMPLLYNVGVSQKRNYFLNQDWLRFDLLSD